VTWCRSVAEADPRGHLTYDGDAEGLVNHGWKDSACAMVHADGAVAPPPIAMVEVQGYHWRALRDLADLEARLGDADAAVGLRAEAATVRSRVLDGFRADGCVVAMARDGLGRRLDVTSSNAGHLLWVGMLDAADAAALAPADGGGHGCGVGAAYAELRFGRMRSAVVSPRVDLAP
jgi:glycogen debranching enzyme